MRKLFCAIFFVGVLTLVNSCQQSDERESQVHNNLEQRVVSESQGALKLDNFKKINGSNQSSKGMKIYSLQWQADISVQQDIWKGGNAFEGYWSSFRVSTKQPSYWDEMAMASSSQHFEKGTKIRLIGNSYLQKTDNGWIVAETDVQSSQILSKSEESNVSNNENLNKNENLNENEANVRSEWSESERNDFINTCTQAASNSMGQEKARAYCSCMQQKLEKKYPNYTDANKAINVPGAMQTPEMQAMVQECLNGNSLNNNSKNNMGATGGNWTREQHQQFVQGCSITAQQQQGMTAQQANAYCDCMTTKVEQKYTFEEASHLTPQDFQTTEWQNAAADCKAKVADQ
jgi:hypothetical protein